MAKKKFELAKLDANELQELDGWKEKMETAVKEFPFVEIVDRESYEIAKKNRTGLRSARTEVQKQDKLIGSFLSNFRKETKSINENLVSIVSPREEKQQTEVSRWEKILEDKANEKALEEERRIEKIKEQIDETQMSLGAFIKNMTFENMEVQERMFEDHVLSRSGFDYQEYDVMFDQMISDQKERLEEMKIYLNKKEEKRLEDLAKDQQAEINRRSVEAQKLIDLSDPTNHHNLIESLNDVFFKPEFDFGDYDMQMINVTKEMTTKAIERIKWIQSNEETEQRNRVIQVREGLLDIVHQMTVEDMAEKTIYVKQALEQKIENLLAPDEFDKMVDRVNEALKMKLESLATQIEKERVEAEKEAERINKRTEQRKSQLTAMGLKWNEADQYFGEEGIDNVTMGVIEELDFADWSTYVQSLKILMNEFQDANNVYQQRVERLKDDKYAMILHFENFNEIVDPELNDDESKKLWFDLKLEIAEFVNEKINKINNF